MNMNDNEKGRLQVSVCSERNSMPVAGATVRITDPADGSVLEVLQTDDSGQTAEIELPAPPPDLSRGRNAARPYASYNVTVSAGQWETLNFAGVQILPDCLAIQNAAVRPAVPDGFNVRNILIDPHVLWSDYPPKIPEDEVKPLPGPGGFIVLPEPVIPEYMIVHLGTPQDDSASDVWVPFKDYIKNVASCEIYSTWPVETIKANVLAILSFTLNRVYTEWYRGKGKNFTITNSTAYDQAYSHGRNIFEEISTVTDELFTTYITRETIRQPLFTQYCDGRRVQCGGLSQWGSQALGEQGMDAVSILRTYYGSDIYLAQAEKVEGVPRSYSGVVLQPGSRGEDVRTIQQQLNKISDNYPAIPKQRVDGVYGDTTLQAVKEFQKIFHLPQSGTVDFATWYEISNVYVAVSQMA